MASHPIKALSLTDYQVAPDGRNCRLCFVDSLGVERALELPLDGLEELLAKAGTTAAAGDGSRSPDDVHVVRSWRVQPASGRRVVFTFTTPEGAAFSFSISGADLGDLAEAAVEYEVEAFPEGLRFPRH